MTVCDIDSKMVLICGMIPMIIIEEGHWTKKRKKKLWKPMKMILIAIS